ncbi:MAG: hypothetical protein ACO24P_06460, partial [Candidatus Nanopelagicaceae bacterium]
LTGNGFTATNSTGVAVTFSTFTGSGVGAAGTANTTGDQLSGITITTPGTGYQVGDVVDVVENGGTGIGSFRVASIT